MAIQTRPPRPELAYERATRAGFDEVAAQLSELLGRKLVAYIGAVKETRAVNQWAAGNREPGSETQLRLRLAPARVLRDVPLEDAGPAVLGAARAFLVGG